MAMYFTDFSRAPIQQSALSTLVDDVFKGYQLGRIPKQMDQEEEQRRLANSLQKLALEHKPKEYQLADALKEAQIKNANRPTQLGGALAQAFALRDRFQPGSKEYNQVDQYINKLGTSSNGVQVSGTPGGGFEISIGGKGDTASIPGLPALKKGETYLYGQDGKPIGIGKPYTGAEEKEASGRAFFNTLQPFLNEAQSYYTGQGSNKRFEEDVLNYSKDAAARKRVNNLLAADKLMFSGVVKENATLGGANTNRVYQRLIKSLESAEIYPILKEKAPYLLESGYGKEVGDIFNQKLNEASDAGTNIPAYKPFYFNNQGNNSSSKAPEIPKSITNRQQFRQWLKTLTPDERAAVKAAYVGAK